MTNPNERPHHNMYGMEYLRPRDAKLVSHTVLRPDRQSGYTLVALIAVMTLLALFALAAAPSLQQQMKRQREKEAIFRGEQVAAAIRAFYLYRTTTLRAVGDQALPTSIDQLLEGIPLQGGSKKLQILRASAAHDPLSLDGEWRLIRPRSQELIDFQQSIIAYAGNQIPPTTDPQMAQLQQLAVPQLAGVLNTGLKDSSPSTDEASDSYTGPFVGVASRSRNSSVLHYYDIERHDQWIFTPLFR